MWLTVAEAAKRLHKTKGGVYWLIDNNKLKKIETEEIFIKRRKTYKVWLPDTTETKIKKD